MEGEIPAHSGNDDEADIADAVGQRAHDAADRVGLNPGLGHTVGEPDKLLRHLRLPAESRHGPVPGDHLLHMAVELSQKLLPAAGRTAHPPGQEPGSRHRQQHHDQTQQRQLPAVPQHHRHGTHDGQRAGEQGGQRLGDCGGDILNIIGHPADQVAAGVGVQILHGQVNGLVKEVLAHPPDDALAQPRAEQALDQLAAAIEQIAAQHQSRRQKQPPLSLAGDNVNGSAL